MNCIADEYISKANMIEMLCTKIKILKYYNNIRHTHTHLGRQNWSKDIPIPVITFWWYDIVLFVF